MIKNLLTYPFLFLLFFSSCTKDPDNKVFMVNDNRVQFAKSYSESHAPFYRFCTDVPVVTKSSSSTLNLLFDWNNYFIKENAQSLAVEVSLQNNPDVESYLSETIEKLSQTTRLIVILDKQKKVYDHFIITKIWLKGTTPDLTNVSFNDTKEDAITLIYNVDGKLEIIYSLKDGLYSLLNLQRKSLAHCLKFSTSDALSFTKINEGGNYLCEYCGAVNFGMECYLCGSESVNIRSGN